MRLYVKGNVSPDETYHARLVLTDADYKVLGATGKLRKVIDTTTVHELGGFIRYIKPTQRIIEVIVEEDKDAEKGKCACAICSCGS